MASHKARCTDNPANMPILLPAAASPALEPEPGIASIESIAEIDQVSAEAHPEPVTPDSRLRRVEARLDNLEGELSALPAAMNRISEVVDAFTEQAPHLVQIAVNEALNTKPLDPGTGTVHEPLAPDEILQVDPATARAPAGIAGLLGGIDLSKMIQMFMDSIDLTAILSQGLNMKAGGGDINTTIANAIFGNKKPVGAGDKMGIFTRGVGQAQAALKMKKVDPNATAITIRAQADEMLNLRNLSPDDRYYWMGRKSEANAFLAAVAMEEKWHPEPEIEPVPEPVPEPIVEPEPVIEPSLETPAPDIPPVPE